MVPIKVRSDIEDRRQAIADAEATMTIRSVTQPATQERGIDYGLSQYPASELQTAYWTEEDLQTTFGNGRWRTVPLDKTMAMIRNPQWTTLIRPWMDQNRIPYPQTPEATSHTTPQTTYQDCNVRSGGDYTAKSNIRFTGQVGGDLNANGFDILFVSGTVGGDVKRAGLFHQSGGSVNGDVRCRIFDQEGGRVGGDAISSEKTLRTDGHVGGDIR